MMNKRKCGSKWEDEAAMFLTECGLKVCDLNFRSRFGEIDIVARDGDYLVFVEVKYRKTASCGKPEEAVDIRKAKIISKVADYYRVVKKIPENTNIRFDVIAIEGDDLRWYKNAFTYMY